MKQKYSLWGIAACVVVMLAAGCKEEKKEERKAPPAPVQEKKITARPSSPDEMLHQLVSGGVEYVVTERYPASGNKRSPEYIDSVWFDVHGRVLGKKSWWVDHGSRIPGTSIALYYTSEGEFERGEENGDKPVLPVMISRNAAGQLVKLDVQSKGDAGSYRAANESWEWRDAVPSHYSQATVDADYSETYRYPEEGKEPEGCLAKTSNEEGSAQETITYNVLQRDEAGNWTEREVTRERRFYEYDYESGKVVESGPAVKESNIERRRISYRD